MLPGRVHRNVTPKSPVFLFIIICFVVLISVRQGKEPLERKHRMVSVHNDLVVYNRDVPIIWLAGLHESGADLTRSILEAHPHIRCGTETSAILNLVGIHKKVMASQGLGICLPVSYESLVIYPDRIMRQVLSFLNVPWCDQIRDQVDRVAKASVSQRELSTDQVNKPINTYALTNWVGDIPDDVLRDMDEIAPMLQRLGYNPDANPPDDNQMNLRHPKQEMNPQARGNNAHWE